MELVDLSIYDFLTGIVGQPPNDLCASLLYGASFIILVVALLGLLYVLRSLVDWRFGRGDE